MLVTLSERAKDTNQLAGVISSQYTNHGSIKAEVWELITSLEFWQSTLISQNMAAAQGWSVMALGMNME